MTELVATVMEHARVSPSSFERAEACSMSVALSANAPPREAGPDADMGTAGHAVLETCLRRDLEVFELGPEPAVDVNGSQVVLDDDTLSGVELCLRYVREATLFRGRAIAVERQLPLHFAEQYLGQPMWGHADVSTDDKRLPARVVDYKNGFNVVEASTPQAGLYALALVLEITNGSLEEYEGHEVAATAVIVQPNAKDAPIREHDWTWNDLQDLRDRVIVALRRIKRRDFTYAHGAHCRWCPAAGFCPHLAAVACDAALARITPSPELVARGEVTAEMLDEAALLIPVLDQWIKKTTEAQLQYIREGGVLKNVKAVRKKTNRRWIDEEAAKARLRELEVDPYAAPKLVSPAEAERRLGKSRKAIVDDELAEKPIGELTLATMDDARPAVNVGLALARAAEAGKAAGLLQTLRNSVQKEKV